MPCCDHICKEFKWRNFGHNYVPQRSFYTSQWRWPPIIFFLYRLLVAVYAIIWLLVIVPKRSDPHWLVFLTNITYTTLTAHLSLSLVIAGYHLAGQPCCAVPRTSQQFPILDLNSHEENLDQQVGNGDNDPLTENETKCDETENETTGENEVHVISKSKVCLPWYMALSWIIFNIVAVFGLVVTIVYFSALFPYEERKVGLHLVENLQVHAVNSVIILLELLLNAIPIRLLHVIYPFVYGFLYVLFSVIYWGVDHNHVIYKRVLDWNHPEYTVPVILGIFALLICIQCLLYGIHRLKVYICSK